ncbi:hypothetical protein [Staphylococcus arlettae]|uniref:hypothetical protein n=1 Tax=Staphylococcus arlettae TaxID=29378 RepID=UPI001E2CC1C7|nr:hypothetical protein [Staphylococcus arlettae]MCD8864786.1 hypothetical protein [Staphylococcus arlettae]
MNKQLLRRTIYTSIVFCLLFFFLNYFGSQNVNVAPLIGKSILATCVLAILYFTLFSMMHTPELKFKFGTTIPIAMLLSILISSLFGAIKIGIIAGLLIGVIAGYIWVFIESKRNGGDSK